MNDMTLLEVVGEVHGTITSATPVGIVFQPDDETIAGFSEGFSGRDYSRFRVGQRVAHVSCKLAGTDEVVCVTYDELSYDPKTLLKVVEEVRGTITSATSKGIVIQPDDETMPIISDGFSGRDYSRFSVGQRVAHVSYKLDGTDEVVCVTYDELSYDQQSNQQEQSARTI